MLTGMLSWFRVVFVENFVLKSLALALALTLVFVKREDRTTNSTASVRVILNYPDDRVLMTPKIDKVKITLEGEYNSLRRLDTESIAAVNLNLSGYEEGQVTFDPEGFRVPPGLRVKEVRPAAMLVRFEALEGREVAVKAKLEGDTARDYRVTEVVVAPSKVRLLGASSVVKGIEHLKTSAISLVGRSQSATLSIPLAPPPLHTWYDRADDRVKVEVSIEERQGIRTFSALDIEIREPSGTWDTYELSPATVEVSVAGTARRLRDLTLSDIRPYITPKVLEVGSVVTLPVELDAVENVETVEANPRKVTWVRKAKPAPVPEGEAARVEGDDAGKPSRDKNAAKEQPKAQNQGTGMTKKRVQKARKLGGPPKGKTARRKPAGAHREAETTKKISGRDEDKNRELGAPSRRPPVQQGGLVPEKRPSVEKNNVPQPVSK